MILKSSSVPDLPEVTIWAASTSQTDVAAAIASASTGDVVGIPAGEVTWTSTLTIPNDKKIVLRGNSNTTTIITGNVVDYHSLIKLGTSGSRVCGIEFRLPNTDSSCINARGSGWRVDHNRFINTEAEGNTIEAVWAIGSNVEGGHPVGVVDHNYMYDTRVMVYGSVELLTHVLWNENLALGTNYAVFVEDNEIHRTHGNCVDSQYGGRYVFRHNTVYNAYIEAHSIQGNDRAARSWEVYNNTIIQDEYDTWIPMSFRGGTGVVFNNTLQGTFGELYFGLDNVRYFTDCPTSGQMTGENPWDGNDDGYGYPGRDQIGRGKDLTLWTTENPYPDQSLEPAYCWNNLHEENPVVFAVRNSCDTIIQANRDYYNGVERPDYTPYTYPHPLQTNWGL